MINLFHFSKRKRLDRCFIYFLLKANENVSNMLCCYYTFIDYIFIGVLDFISNGNLHRVKHTVSAFLKHEKVYFPHIGTKYENIYSLYSVNFHAVL